ncbi:METHYLTRANSFERASE-RELATED, putative [Babesia bigemina]|uniref:METHYLTRANSFERASE-RELATED, putative n=1 Tax=Babesia bigemina TaxID=5866 RepID=A0A061DEF6_BABBI|nr:METHYLTRANSFERASE-RELATED, putative [Babesia bigemina]CDR97195.1 METHYLTRANSFERASE-RELATED, putative [Babesia bigemina]|eukprot:XP_012769381.1 METHYLTRANSFERASE-RELATED, putative [Babesia bigemina]
MATRPEHLAPPEIYYNSEEARRYTVNTHIRDIQVEMSQRATEMLLLPEDECCLVLDIGCGSGLSGSVLNDHNNFWIGIDISAFMLEEAVRNECDKEGDMILGDIGEPMNFKPQSFDGAISISALQWLCVANKSSHDPYKRLLTFFKWLYRSLNYGARAAIQFYPENAEQIEMITSAATRCNFGGGLVVDFPESTKAKKYYLCIWAGMTGIPQKMPQALMDVESDEEETVKTGGGMPKRNKRQKKQESLRQRIINKKQQQRRRGIETRPDTKYTGRARPGRF